MLSPTERGYVVARDILDLPLAPFPDGLSWLDTVASIVAAQVNEDRKEGRAATLAEALMACETVAADLEAKIRIHDVEGASAIAQELKKKFNWKLIGVREAITTIAGNGEAKPCP